MNELQRLRLDNEKLHRRIAQLEDDAKLVGRGASEMLRDAREQRDQYRDQLREYKTRIKALEADRIQLVERYGQLEFYLNPRRFDLRKLPAPNWDNAIITQEPPIPVGYMIVARPLNDDPIIRQGGGMFLGSPDAFIAETERMMSLVWRAPMPENLRGPRIEGLTEQQLLTAICEMSMHWHDDTAREVFNDRLDGIFTELVEPYYDKRTYSRSQAKNLFREATIATFQNMSQARNTRPDKPKGKRKKRKS